ncbi:MAG: tetratricopeptide repeat protein [Caldilineaceae bacterium]|nr:tetratricopeptide repeat protein [Caldilineaceae bacterium]
MPGCGTLEYSPHPAIALTCDSPSSGRIDMPTFAELLTRYLQRSGISDSELARTIGVSRLTVFRWKEGIVARPRHRDDVLRCATKLRLSPAERDELLLAAGFLPEEPLDPTLTAGRAPTAPRLEPEIESVDPTLEGPVVEVTARRNPAMRRLALALTLALLLVVSAVLVVDPPGWSRGVPTPILTPISTLISPVVSTGAATTVPATLSTPAPTTITATAPSPTSTTFTAGPHMRAPADETWIVVARFTNYAPDASFNVAGRIQEALDEQLRSAALLGTRSLLWPDEIATHNQAEAVVASSRAAMLIWGEYDSGRVRVNFTVQGDLPDEERDLILTSSDELLTTINVELPREVRSLALLTLARLYREQGNYLNMRAALQRALDQQPAGDDTLATLHFYLGYAFQHGDGPNLDRAIVHYSEAIDRQPTWLNARYNRGLAHLQASYGELDGVSRLDAAIADLSWVVAQRPDLDKPWVNRGIAYYERNQDGDLAAAIADFSQAARRRPTNHRAYYNRALAPSGKATQTAGRKIWPRRSRSNPSLPRHTTRSAGAMSWHRSRKLP